MGRLTRVIPNDGPFAPGVIAFAPNVSDAHGRNHKARRVVLIKRHQDRWLAVAISKSEPLPNDANACVLLPYSIGRRHPKTSLTEKSWAFCNWITIVDESEIARVGYCPEREFKAIVDLVDS